MRSCCSGCGFPASRRCGSQCRRTEMIGKPRERAMADERQTKLRKAVHLPNMKTAVRSDAESLAAAPLSSEQNFLKRKAEVTQQDHADFSGYVQEKSERDRQQNAPTTDAPRRPSSKVN